MQSLKIKSINPITRFNQHLLYHQATKINRKPFKNSLEQQTQHHLTENPHRKRYYSHNSCNLFPYHHSGSPTPARPSKNIQKCQSSQNVAKTSPRIRSKFVQVPFKSSPTLKLSHSEHVLMLWAPTHLVIRPTPLPQRATVHNINIHSAILISRWNVLLARSSVDLKSEGRREVSRFSLKKTVEQRKKFFDWIYSFLLLFVCDGKKSKKMKIIFFEWKVEKSFAN